MRGSRVVATVLTLFLAVPVRLFAGLYNTSESPVITQNFVEYGQFRSKWDELRAIGSEQSQSPLRKRYLLVAGIALAARTTELTSEQRLNVGEYLIRLRRYQEAIAVLEPAALRDRTNSLVVSNLATAYQLNGQDDRAIGYLEQALSERNWPKKWENLSNEQQRHWTQFGVDQGRFEWYRRVEEHQLKLLRLRARETLSRPRGQAGLVEDVDALFDDNGKPPQPVQFIGESGQYEAGALAAAEQAKLPADAVQIVEQLLVWLPGDARLYWLLADLLSAAGNLTDAKAVFDDLVVNRGLHPRTLKDHRQAVTEAAARQKPQENRPAPATFLPAWQPLAVAFGAGAIVALLASWQVREIRRRMGNDSLRDNPG